MNIVSPMPAGNGAFVVHKLLERDIDGYQVCGFNPRWTFFPPSLYGLCRESLRRADLIHLAPDHAPFFHHEGKPQVVTFHHLVLDNYMQQYSSVGQRIHYRTDLKWFIKAALKRASRVTSVSRFTADLVRKELGYNGEIDVITNGVDAELFSPDKGCGTAASEVRVLFAGNLTRRKGADLLPGIARHLNKNINILYTSGLRCRAKLAESTRLQQLGPVLYSDMPDLYRSVDLLLMPTVREGFPLVVTEAMASGLPVIATDCSSLPELIDEGKGGFLCSQGDARAFAEKINLLAESAQLRKEMGEYNREKVERQLRLETMIQAYRDTFSEVLGRQ
jgi:glycosyltransferase involved in cell wall biosynthesis